MALLAELREKYPPQKMGFQLQHDASFTPPANMQALVTANEVEIDLLRGAQAFFGLVQKQPASFGVVEDFFSATQPHEPRHRFLGSTLDLDDEWASSQRFAKVVGISFMTSFADMTWFAPLGKKGRKKLEVADGALSFSKATKTIRSPDYLAAPFDVERSILKDLGPLHALEFKGYKPRVDFTSSTFEKWQTQAANIRGRRPDGTSIALKSWVLAFNYGLEKGGPRVRTESELLVDDHWTGGEGATRLTPQPASIEPIIRLHLARQCRQLGIGILAPFILAGEFPAYIAPLPTVFSVNHPRLRSRRYTGYWSRMSSGSLIGSDASLSWIASLPRSAFEIEAFEHGAYVWIRGPRGSRDAHIEIHYRGGPQPPSSRDIINSILRWADGGESTVFVGQDANMLRQCMTTRVGAGLGGESFTDPIELLDAGSQDGTARRGYDIRLIRSGSIIVEGSAVHADENSLDWWRSS